MRENGETFKTYTGVHTEGFEPALREAVEDYERREGVPPEPVRLRVVDMSVIVHNPIHDYRVVLSPSS